jgi:5'-methylthioadenosine phosphorylase
MVHRSTHEAGIPMPERVIGVIGGSGIYGIRSLTEVEEVQIETPFGSPSGPLITGRLDGARMVFLARHDRGHRLLPHEINYRANIFAMKTLGVEWLISLSAVGSMREDIRPGDMVVVDQYFDRTVGRPSTFFGDGIAAHVGFADPVSPILAGALYAAACEVAERDPEGFTVHRGGTYMVMNGPQFSTRAESRIYRSWGVDVIGMTNMPEAKLAREAEISYACLALPTDYDCWHESEEDVSVEAVIAVLRKNAERALEVVARTVSRVPAEHHCIASRALENAIMTDRSMIPDETRRRLAPLIKKYLP